MKIKSIFGILALLFSSISNAATVIPSDYMIAGSAGDTWNYQRLDNTLFTWTLSEVAAGPNSGRFERGNNDSGIVYDEAGDVLSIYEIDKNSLIPPLVIDETELGQVVTYDDGTPNPTQYLFLEVPSVTVQAGTFKDVLAWVFLDGNFNANPVNTLLGLNPLITAAVTDINLFALGIGEIAYIGVDALTGNSDGLGHELISTSVVPIPAAIWLFGTAFLGLVGFSMRKNAA
jgi:hypothetical protein